MEAHCGWKTIWLKTYFVAREQKTGRMEGLGYHRPLQDHDTDDLKASHLAPPLRTAPALKQPTLEIRLLVGGLKGALNTQRVLLQESE